ncbi:hypothetical protein EVAR_79150_1 [Eumeta japonica]|uniref:Uncharacterized protein n=1 Tax=Eumeta variegata TaxID=151549 RepID=A0A4C1UT08_EUMVA|nr:hypothetical protein EVAR_79150_1 [Eumeta japonica]
MGPQFTSNLITRAMPPYEDVSHGHCRRIGDNHRQEPPTRTGSTNVTSWSLVACCFAVIASRAHYEFLDGVSWRASAGRASAKIEEKLE